MIKTIRQFIFIFTLQFSQSSKLNASNGCVDEVPFRICRNRKSHYAKENEQHALDLKIKDVALQKPNRKLIEPSDNPERLQELINRRSGIEPIIGYLKRKWQMGRSKMKLDRSTESSGFTAMLGWNLHQLLRCLAG